MPLRNYLSFSLSEEFFNRKFYYDVQKSAPLVPTQSNPIQSNPIQSNPHPPIDNSLHIIHLYAFQWVYFLHFFESKFCILPCFLAPQHVLQFTATLHLSLGRLKYVVTLLRTPFSPVLPSSAVSSFSSRAQTFRLLCRYSQTPPIYIASIAIEFSWIIIYEGLINTSNNGRPVGAVAWQQVRCALNRRL